MLISAKAPYNPQKHRIFIFVFMAAVAFLILVFRLWYLQIIQYSKYSDLSKNNRIRLVRVKAPRGIIYDKNNIPLVSNRPAFDASLILEDVENDLENILSRFGKLFDLNVGRLKTAIKQKHKPFQPIILKADLSFMEVAQLEEHKIDLAGILVRVKPARSYSFNQSAAHLLGYMGEIGERQLNAPQYQKSKMGDFIGQAGIEKVFNSVLTGVDGGRQVEVNAQGRELKVLGELEPKPGLNLVLTLDSRLQLAAEKLFEGKTGALIALNPQNGKVLCLLSKPNFDPNKFSTGISKTEWDKILADVNDPLQNRVIQSSYPPGSIFKIIPATAALEREIIDKDTELSCNGVFRLGSWTYDCWKGLGHGPLKIHQSLVYSCNVFFYQLGNRLGIEDISYWAYKMGLGRATGIDMPDEKTGLVPTSQWKLNVTGEKWQPGETITTAIGQGFVTTTPIQLANLVSAIANGGTLYKPWIVDRIITADGQTKRTYHPEVLSKLPVSESTLQILRQGLFGVVNDEHGTGARARVEGLNIAGKTGTAQVVRKRVIAKTGEEIPTELRDHAWFVAFAPADNAEIAMAVLVEHGGSGGKAAAPIARELIKEYFRLKARQAWFNHRKNRYVTASPASCRLRVPDPYGR